MIGQNGSMILSRKKTMWSRVVLFHFHINHEIIFALQSKGERDGKKGERS